MVIYSGDMKTYTTNNLNIWPVIRLGEEHAIGEIVYDNDEFVFSSLLKKEELFLTTDDLEDILNIINALEAYHNGH